MTDEIEIPEGFMRWDGGGRPVSKNTLVCYVLRGWPKDICEEDGIEAKALSWRHDGDNSDIIAYRIVP